MKRLAAAALIGVTALPLQASPPDWRNNQLLLPEKVTVGPSDNYQAQFDANQQRLFFTRHQTLVSQVVEQHLETGQTRELLSPDHDAKDPALAPDGQSLAITSFRRNALGSVCVLPLQGEGQQLDCITEDGQRAWLPFWVNQHTLGYLRRSSQGREQELVFHDLNTQQVEVRAQGQLSAPSVSSDGRYLVYLRREASQQGIHVEDLSGGQLYGPLLLDLPGISSYSLYNPKDGHLYLSHFLSDTSGDQQIDGEDHSVIFRIPLQPLLQAKQPQLPEQLTSVTHNCNFPALGEDHLYMTCAYEGSLDTYRLPLTGQLPQHWELQQIKEAQATASRQAERLLLINSQRYRQGSTEFKQLEQLLANHLQMNELTAALFYTQQLAQHSQAASQVAFYKNLALLLQLKADYQLQPPGQLTSSYRQQLHHARTLLNAEGEQAVFMAWLAFLSQQPQLAREQLQEQAEASTPLANYLQVELALELAETTDARLTALLAASNNSVFSADARTYYGFHYLQVLAREQRGHWSAHQQQLEQAAQQLDDPRLHDLFANELDLLALAQATERNEERALYQAISSRLRDWRDEPQMHRAGHIRALQLMGLAEKYDFMELMSRHWLTTTGIRQVDFAATAHQYATVNLNRGYGAWSQGEQASALNTFYSVLRQTSDLEALFNLLQLGLDPNADASLQERMQRLYDQLVAEELLGKNTFYAEALKPLLSNAEPHLDLLKEAAEKLQGLEVSGLDAGVKDLLLGYLYHRQLLITQEGYQRDQELAQRSHYHYMLGLDLAYHNPRIQASLLENLGQLHFQLGNHGLAAEFFGQRLNLPWLSEEHKVWLYWRQARALYYSNRYPRAAEQSYKALQLAEHLGLSEAAAVAERTAFYALQAQDYYRAAKLYQKLLDDGQLEGNNAIKGRFSYAYALFHLGEQQAAHQAFEQLLDTLPEASQIPARNDRLVSFQPRRLEVQAYGFLAQLSEQPSEQIFWLKKRLQLLQQLASKDRRYAWDEQGRYSLIIQSRLQKAQLLESENMLEPAAAQMRASLQDVQNYQRASGPFGSQPVLQSLYNYLTLASYHPQAFAEEPQALDELISATLDALYLDTFMPPVNHYQRLKLQLLHQLYSWRRQDLDGEKAFNDHFQPLQAGKAWQGLASTRPDLHAELESLYMGIQQLVLAP